MKVKGKVVATVFLMGLAYALIYALPFVQYVFYDPLVEGLNSTNAQLGTLIAIFGLGNIFGAPIGGWVSDRFNTKYVYIIGLLGTAILNFILSFFMSYNVAIFVWIGLAVSGLFAFFPAHIKLVRQLVDEDSQGTIFGLAESAAGIGAVVVNVVALFLFNQVTSQVVGLQMAIRGYGVMTIIVAVILWFVLKSPSKEAVTAADKIKFKDFGAVLKYPGTWLAGIAIFSSYTLYVSLSYFTPYFTDVLKTSVAFSGGLAIVRTYLTRFVGAPVGGVVGDKLGSVSKVLAGALLASLVIIFTFRLLPVGTSINMLIMFTIILAFFAYMARGTMFAVAAEVKCNPKYAATTAGITCAIGYSPDLFQFTLFGNWLDNYGNQGYDYIFIYTMVVLAVGIASSLFVLKYKKKVDARNSDLNEIA